MTYWYPGAREALETAREVFPRSKIVLGGIYPSLCYEHALRTMTDADLIVRNSEAVKFYQFVEENTGIALNYKPDLLELDRLPYPCYDLYEDIPFVSLVTSYGCMYRCAYCATPYMYPTIIRRKTSNVIDEIRHWHEYGVERYVLYDDSFLYRSSLYAKPLLKAMASLSFSVNIYNPNAVNAALVDEEAARLMVAAGFKEVRIGLESIDRTLQKSTGGKVSTEIFERAVNALLGGGFSRSMIEVYILAGLPEQRCEDVKDSIDYLADLGIRAHIAEYTPIPHTKLFDEFHALSRYPIAEDPIYQNNALFPFAWEGFTEKDLASLKVYAREKRDSTSEAAKENETWPR
jgi:radical SAM superfamily enzyme YgiQ (UPF0313 family)